MLRHGLPAAIAGGWALSAFMTANTGFPIAVTSPNNSGSFGGGTPELPNATGVSALLAGGPQIVDGGLYFNPAAFTQTPAYAFGNVTRFVPGLYSPGVFNWDSQITREFPLRERIRLQFRAEFFNTLNRVQFAGPNVAINAPSTFGHIYLSQANTPRNIQVAMRLIF
jgi:hypothetical protein